MWGCNTNKWDCEKYLDCDICLQDKIAEHEKRIRAEAIDGCKTILKLHHMFRTCEDDFNAKIEVPFYTGLWKKFDQLKEQNND